MNPIVTTVIPIYNKGKYLNRCLESIVSQSIQEIEILLINDGSTDNSLDICREWEKKDNRIRVIDKENEGAGAARNEGIKESAGRYISFVDADDYIDRDTYKICIKVLEDTKSEACYFGRNLVSSEGTVLNHSVKLDCTQVYEGERIGKEFINFFLGNLPQNEYERHFVTGSSCCMLLDGNFIRNNKIFFLGKELRYSEDLFLNLQICRYAKKIVVIPDMLYYNCLYQDSKSRGYARTRFQAYKLLYDKMLEIIPYCKDAEDARLRIDFHFAMNITKCVKDEARYADQNGLKKAYRNIKEICRDGKTQECLPGLIRKGYASNRNMLLKLIVRKKAGFILGYYLLKKKKHFSPLWLTGRMIIASCFLFLFVGILKFGMKDLLIDRGYADSEFIPKVINFVYRDNPGAEVVKETSVSIDWEKRYPFASEEKDAETGTAESKKKKGFLENKLAGVEAKIAFYKAKISYYFEESLFGRNKLLETGAVLESVLQWNIPERVKSSPNIFWGGKEDHISQCKSKADVTEISENLTDFAGWVQEQGISFVYVQYPEKMSGIKTELLPKGFYSYADENADRILEKLKAESIPCLDIRADLMPQGADNMFDLFFRTDHHWLPQTALKAAGMLAEYFSREGMDIDTELFEPQKYTIENYEGIFLGSYGRDVTAGLIDPDDFQVVTPDFDTFLKITIPDLNIERQGCFEETLLNMNMLYLQPSYELSQYDVYLWSDRPLIEIKNERTRNHNRILVLKDSFGNTVNPYLALAFEEMSVIDLRHFTGSIRTYIEEYKPDYVMVSYSPRVIAETADDKPRILAWDFR